MVVSHEQRLRPAGPARGQYAQYVQLRAGSDRAHEKTHPDHPVRAKFVSLGGEATAVIGFRGPHSPECDGILWRISGLAV